MKKNGLKSDSIRISYWSLFLSSSMMLQMDNLYYVFLLQTVTNVLGPELHAKRIGKIHLVQFASEGVFGWIPTHGQIISQFLSGD